MPPRIKQALNASILAAGVGFCIVALIRLQAQHPLHWSFSVVGVLAAAVCAGVALAAMAIAWQLYMKAFFDIRLALGDALFQICVMLIGKYVPVMIGGFLARISANTQDLSAKQIVAATMVEQIGAMGAALLIGVCCYVFAVAPMAAPLMIVCAIIVVWCAPLVLEIALRLFAQLRGTAFGSSSRASDNHRDPRLLRQALGFQILQWIALAGFVGGSIAMAAPHLAWPSLIAASGAYAIAVVVGIAIFFLPGGIGAREAVFVWLVSGRIDSHEALQLALALRLAMSALDLAAGAICVVVRRPVPGPRIRIG